MESTAVIAEKLSSSNNKRRNIIISACAGLVIVGALLTVLLTSAKSQPEIINQQFANSTATTAFTTTGSGTWQVLNGTYQLSNPAPLQNQTAGNSNLSINTAAITQGEWQLNTDAKALSTGGNGSHDFSIIFNYTDETNYYYANFSDKKDATVNGIFQVKAGTQSKLVSFPDTITLDANNQVEIRQKNGEAKVYLGSGSKYQGKVSTAKYASSRVGYGSRGGAAVFDNLIVSGQGTVASPTPSPTPEPSPTPPPSNPGGSGTGSGGASGSAGAGTVTTTPNGRIISVTNSDQLTAALASAQAGDDIKLADGTYAGKAPVCAYTDKGKQKVITKPCSYQKDSNGKVSLLYNDSHTVAATSGGNTVYTGSFSTPDLKLTDSAHAATAAKPILIEGSRKAIIDGGGTGGHYGLYLVDADYWQVKGITIANATKGLVMDRSSHVLLDGIEVTSIGQEAVHFRDFSDHGTIQNSYVHKTGQKNAAYGEGIYVGSANSNWATYSGGIPDKSDNVLVQNNLVTDIGAEGLDIKEGSSNGVIKGNTFDGASVQGKNSADSWVDVKGNNYTLEGNKGVYAIDGRTGTHIILDGYQVHNVYAGWGFNNVFTGNSADMGNAKGFGFMVQKSAQGNIIYCNNTVSGAASGLSNIGCKQ